MTTIEPTSARGGPRLTSEHGQRVRLLAQGDWGITLNGPGGHGASIQRPQGFVDALGKFHIGSTMLIHRVARGLPEIADDTIGEEVDFKMLRGHVHLDLDGDDLVGHQGNVALKVPMLITANAVLRAFTSIGQYSDCGTTLRNAIFETHR